jgi:RNA polymerase sigma-70 factor (ECF subfamily)
LREILLQAADDDVASDLRGQKNLGELLESKLSEAKGAWPQIAMDEEAFVTHIARCLGGAVGAGELIEGLHIPDLFLAFACGRGDAKAVAAFEANFVSAIPEVLARMGKVIPKDEVVQLLRAKVLLAQGERPPKILDYSGRGPLAGWLRVAAVRTALDLARQTPAERSPNEDVLEGAAATSEDPELLHIRRRHVDDFKAAFKGAMSALSVEDRNILRLQLVDGLSIDEIGAVFGVHRATAARWLARCRERVRDETKRLLSERLNMTDSEFHSMVLILQSDLDISISGLLKEE